MDERKGDGKTTTPGKVQYLRHGKICFMASSLGENRLVHGEKETIRRNSLRNSYSLHTTQGYHARISFVCFLKNRHWDFIAIPVVKTLSSNAAGAASIPGQAAKISDAITKT